MFSADDINASREFLAYLQGIETMFRRSYIHALYMVSSLPTRD